MDPTGFTCNDPVAVQQIADMIRTYSATSVTCNGHVWSQCDRDEGELWIDPPEVCSLYNCPAPGYILRACFSSTIACSFSGLNSDTCGAPVQTITLEFF